MKIRDIVQPEEIKIVRQLHECAFKCTLEAGDSPRNKELASWIAAFQSKSTLACYTKDLKSYLGYLIEKNIRGDLKSIFEIKNVTAWVAYLQETGNRSSSINRKISSLNNFIKHFNKISKNSPGEIDRLDGLGVPISPTKHLPYSTYNKVRIDNYLNIEGLETVDKRAAFITTDEYLKALNRLIPAPIEDIRNKLTYSLMLFHGLSSEQISNLKIKDINYAIKENKQTDLITVDKDKIELHPQVAKLLVAYLVKLHFSKNESNDPLLPLIRNLKFSDQAQGGRSLRKTIIREASKSGLEESKATIRNIRSNAGAYLKEHS